MQEVVEAAAKKVEKNQPDEPYKNVLKFITIGKLLLFKNENYQISVSIELISKQMCPTICALDSGTGSDLFQADRSGLKNICRRVILDTCSVSDFKTKVTGTMKVHLLTDESRIWVGFGVENESVALTHLGTIYIGRFVKLVNSSER